MNLVRKLKGWFLAEFRQKGFSWKITLVLMHTLLLAAFTIALQYTSYVRADELGFLKWAAVIRHNVLHIDPKPLADSVVFLDISKDITTIDDPSEAGSLDSAMGLKGAQMVVTDRKKLAYLFAELNKHRDAYKFVLCDVLFEDNAPGDSALKQQIEKLPRLMVAGSAPKGKLDRPLFNVQFGLADYTAINGSSFVKMPIFALGNLKSYPVAMYEETTAHRFTRHGAATYEDGAFALNTIIPELYYRDEDLERDSGKVNTYDLFKLVSFPDYFSVLKHKYIVIGNFKNDRHNSYLGSIPGTLVLWDTYLTLRNHPLKITAIWTFLLCIVYFLISYWIILHPEQKLEELHKKIHVPLISKFIIKYLSFIGILVAVNIISYFYFGTFISLFYVATYLTFLQLVIDKAPEWKLKTSHLIHKIYKRHDEKTPAAAALGDAD